jgi:DNA-binding NarL/FixJ family response regulator
MRVVIGEDQALFREGLARLLTEAGFAVVGQACDATELLVKVGAQRPDVVVTDVRMPPDHTDDGLRAARVIRTRFAGTAVLVLSQYVVERAALELIGDSPSGVGYLLKNRVRDIDAFIEAIQRVAAGGSALDPDVVGRLIGRRQDPLAGLTTREREVLTLMAEGCSNHGIAERLVVTDHAVEKHVNGILRKLGIGADPVEHRRVLAVLAFLRTAASHSGCAIPPHYSE